MTIPFMYNFQSSSNHANIKKIPYDFLKFNFSNFTPRVRLFYVDNKEFYNFWIQKCDERRNLKNYLFQNTLNHV